MSRIVKIQAGFVLSEHCALSDTNLRDAISNAIAKVVDSVKAAQFPPSVVVEIMQDDSPEKETRNLYSDMGQ